VQRQGQGRDRPTVWFVLLLGKQFERRDYPKGFFAESVKVAKNEFRVGNLFEVVLSQAFREILKVKPSKVFRR
jgi:anthranilate/para-aminobenzoate synthase component I